MGVDDADRDEQRRRILYERVCESYHAVDDFRTKLLGLLPIATGSAVFLLLSTKADSIGISGSQLSPSLAAIGMFGLVFTVGLFAYELFGIKKCHYIIETGRRLERQMQVRGQFRARPHAILGRVNEPFASAFIYPGCMAAWAFLGLAMVNGLIAAAVASFLFLAGLVATLKGARQIGVTYDREEKVLELLAREAMTINALRSRIGIKESWVIGTVTRLRERGELLDRAGVLETAR